ncbi:galactokinase [Pedobacter westerhofensis]|uniref:Galactokinase n=1 Tax=Pedobacter westerhofensis TaxID=425512 RepID=A0A521FI72_9SPHI|nr:galactokinase [Pedobacter westerhofensis]SMO95922.1 galactokinase [Pedobacter westerhofensis]
MKDELANKFFETYGHQPEATYFTPGRVNLIGEHIDYNGGLVFPCAITLGTWLALAPNNDRTIRFKSLNFPEEAEIPLESSYTKDGSGWYNYPLGVFNEILKNFQIPVGFDLLYTGNIPIGSGLSSSASIEVVTAYALTAYLELDYDRLALVKMSKRVENDFIGLNSGIMDQFAVAFGEKDKAIVLNCDTLEYKIVDCDLGDHVLTIINTKKPRGLAESKYNERVSECQAALAALNTEVKISNLCELTPDKFALHSHLITDETILKRATHVIHENERVSLAAKALSEGKLEEFGTLMYASHQSLKDLYEVSGLELDTVVDFCADYADVTGARMTGAGFGGCAIAILKKDAVEDFTEKLTAYYQERVGYACEVYVSKIGNGATTI